MRLLKIEKSKAKNKKFTAFFEVEGKEKRINFGDSRYRDFTLMNDKNSKFYEPIKEKRDKVKDNYQKRHKKDLLTEAGKKGLSAGALSFYILWTKPTISGGLKMYKAKYFS